MTVISNTNRIDHEVVDIGQVNYIYDFRVDRATQMRVFHNGVLLSQGAYLTFGLGDPQGGYIEILFVVELADEIIIMRILPLTQNIDYVPYGKFPAETHELGLDWGIMIDQQQREELNRCFKAPIGWPGGEFIVPEPDAGMTLVWREDERGFDNAPGEESFLSWVDRSEAGATESEAARDLSVSWANNSYLWAQQEEDVLVNDGQHPEGYSAYHWARKAEEGGIYDIGSEDELMMVVNTPSAKYRSLEMITGTPGGMVKLDNVGLVPLENLPFTGNIRFIAPIEGHNRCPKYEYTIPDETPCVEPDTRNPSERIPSISWVNGDYFVIVGIDELPLLNQMNLINPDTQLYEITDVVDGDAVIYLAGDVGVTTPGWYLYPGFAGGDVLAENVIFDDSMTDIKGVNVQLWNQAADAVIAGKIDDTGGLMTGPLQFMNNIRLQWYLVDSTTLVDVLSVDTIDRIIIGGYSTTLGDTLINKSGITAINISGVAGTGYVALDRRLSLPNSVAIRLEDTTGAPSDSMYLSNANRLILGSAANILGTDMYAAGTLVLALAPTAATFSSNVYLPNALYLLGRNGANTGDNIIARMTASDQVQIGGSAAAGNTYIYASNTLALNIATDAVTCNLPFRMLNNSPITGLNAAGNSNLNMLYIDTGDRLNIGNSVGSASTWLFGGNVLAAEIGTNYIDVYHKITTGNEQGIEGWNAAGTERQDIIKLSSSDVIAVGTPEGPIARFFNGIGYTTVDMGAGISGATELDWTYTTHITLALGGPTTFTFINPVYGVDLQLIIRWPQDTFTFTDTIYWRNGNPPTSVLEYMVINFWFAYNGLIFGDWNAFAL